MKDLKIKEKVDDLVNLVNKINSLMSDLQDLDVEVRIQYIEPKSEIKQSIKIWKCVEHNDYLKNE